MGVLSEKELNLKLEECIALLDSDSCNDVMFILFVVGEYFKYLAALKSGIGLFNLNSVSSTFEFGYDLYSYRNTFAHIDTVDNLNRLMEVCKEYRDDICSYFTGDVYFKVYNALN